MKTLPLLMALVSVCGLAGCGPAPGREANPPSAPTASTEGTGRTQSGDTGPAAVASAAQSAQGSGTVTAVDGEGGTITLRHGPIDAVHWPAMTMAFKATPAQIASVKAGDAVAFTFTLDSRGAALTTVAKR